MSLDYCADQYVLALVPKARIAAVSALALSADSAARDQARGFPRRRADLETILASGADIAVTSFGLSPHQTAVLTRQGMKVVSLNFAEDFAGIRANLVMLAEAAAIAPAASIDTFDAELSALSTPVAQAKPRALYLTGGGALAGPGTLPDAMMLAAGLDNVVATPGWSSLRLEEMVAAPPEVVITAFAFDQTSQQAPWALSAHRVFSDFAKSAQWVDMPRDLVACAGPASPNGIRVLRERLRP